MPIVFGGAVSVTAAYSTWQLDNSVSVSPLLWIGMLMVVVGVIVVARNTPHAHAKPSAVDHAVVAPAEPVKDAM
jgi:hypothetical protein